MRKSQDRITAGMAIVFAILSNRGAPMTHCTVAGISLGALLCVATGCIPGEPRDVATCEAVTKSALKAPSTYRLVDTTRDMKPGFSRIFLKFRSEEHTSELQSLMRISYAVFCLKKKK